MGFCVSSVQESQKSNLDDLRMIPAKNISQFYIWEQIMFFSSSEISKINSKRKYKHPQIFSFVFGCVHMKCQTVCVSSSLADTLCGAAVTTVAGVSAFWLLQCLATSRRHCQLRVTGPTERKQNYKNSTSSRASSCIDHKGT